MSNFNSDYFMGVVVFCFLAGWGGGGVGRVRDWQRVFIAGSMGVVVFWVGFFTGNCCFRKGWPKHFGRDCLSDFLKIFYMQRTL